MLALPGLRVAPVPAPPPLPLCPPVSPTGRAQAQPVTLPRFKASCQMARIWLAGKQPGRLRKSTGGEPRRSCTGQTAVATLGAAAGRAPTSRTQSAPAAPAGARGRSSPAARFLPRPPGHPRHRQARPLGPERHLHREPNEERRRVRRRRHAPDHSHIGGERHPVPRRS